MIEWIQHWDEMRFYYWSGLSWIMILPVYVGGVLLLGLLWWLLAKVWKMAWIVIIAMLPVLAIAPWWEELTIAWNFGQLCKKDAGIFIYRSVEVEGFYDSTMSSGFENIQRSGYQFMEHWNRERNQVDHIERANHAAKAGALAWFAKNNAGKQPPKSGVVIQPISHRERVTVFMDTGDAYRIKILDHPTARYHFKKPHSHTVVSHKIKMFEYLVEDSQTKEVLAREKTYAREAPWYFIGFDQPTRFCPISGNYGEKIHATIYDLVMKPAARR